MVKNVAKISKATADIINKIEYIEGILFGPTQDADNNWIISLQEAQYLDLSKWEVTEFNPKIEEQWQEENI